MAEKVGAQLAGEVAERRAALRGVDKVEQVEGQKSCEKAAPEQNADRSSVKVANRRQDRARCHSEVRMDRHELALVTREHHDHPQHGDDDEHKDVLRG